MIRRIAVAIILTIPFSVCIGRGASVKDSTYIGAYDNDLTVKLFFKDNFVSVIREFNEIESTFKTNRPLSTGLGLYYKGYGFSFSYGFNALRNSIKGQTESLDIQYSYYGKNCVIDILAQSHKGFYLDKKISGIFYRTFPDLRVCRAGIYYQYIFNSDRFSFKSVFGNSEKQLRSAGTWFAGGGISGGMMTNNGRYVFPYDDTNLKAISIFHIGPNGGYAYNWIFRDHFYLNLSASLGIDMVLTNARLNITPSTIVRTGLGFDNGIWALYMNYQNNIIFPVVANDERVGMSSGALSLGTLFRI